MISSASKCLGTQGIHDFLCIQIPAYTSHTSFPLHPNTWVHKPPMISSASRCLGTQGIHTFLCIQIPGTQATHDFLRIQIPGYTSHPCFPLHPNTWVHKLPMISSASKLLDTQVHTLTLVTQTHTFTHTYTHIYTSTHIFSHITHSHTSHTHIH